MSKSAPILAGVVGYPVSHSLSPLIHTIWASRAGADGHYLPIAVQGGYDVFSKAIDSLRTIGFAGVNVTLPHKEHALRYADDALENAVAAGAANMLTFHDGRCAADNSDIAGFAEALRAKLRPDDEQKTALVLGAGGAARGVVQAVRQAGYRDILLTNRTRSKAEVLKAQASDISVLNWTDRNQALRNADLVVNTTSLGMTGQPPLEVELAGLKKSAVVADIVYAPLETPLLQRAASLDLRVVDGLAMLMHQAVPGFRAWFNAPAKVDEALRKALISELERRSQS